MEQNTPFRILSHAELLALPRADKLRYLARALEAHRILLAQLAQGGDALLPNAAPAANVENRP